MAVITGGTGGIGKEIAFGLARAVAKTIIADCKYGTVENYIACQNRKLRTHMADLLASRAGSGRRDEIYPESQFLYRAQSDTYLCPAGQVMRPRRLHPVRRSLRLERDGAPNDTFFGPFDFESVICQDCLVSFGGINVPDHIRSSRGTRSDAVFCFKPRKPSERSSVGSPEVSWRYAVWRYQ